MVGEEVHTRSEVETHQEPREEVSSSRDLDLAVAEYLCRHEELLLECDGMSGVLS